jgi:hypothetical protein
VHNAQWLCIEVRLNDSLSKIQVSHKLNQSNCMSTGGIWSKFSGSDISFVRLGLLSCVCTFFLTWSLCLHSTVLATVSAMSWLITGELMWDNVRQVNYTMCYQSSTKSTQLPSWEGWSIQARLALQVRLLLKQHCHQYWSKKDSPWWAIPKVLMQDRPLEQLFGLVNDRHNLVHHCYHLKLFHFNLEFADQVVIVLIIIINKPD